MEMTGERRIPAPRQRVWDALNDPEVLRASIPGCESVERVGDDQFQAKVALKIGPMSAKFGGKVRLENLQPPERYSIVGEGNGGAMGFAKGGSDVVLTEDGPDATLLAYTVKAQVGGKIAQLGARLIDSTAKSMADQFFNRFAAQLTPAEAPATAAAPVSTAPVAAASGEPGLVTPDPVAPAGAASVADASPAVAAPPAAAQAGTPVRGTDTEYMADRGPAPITQHGATGTAPTGDRVARPNPTPGPTPMPLRLLTMTPFGLPIQFWLGSAAMLVILVLLFLW
ncbi:carbon monoxide dehydrogenase subunit G [Roseomonas sp. NAR14]|uniref:Carbon monoxide dehydrogenase subunit G n=1 Tax=Roseomonas acroporae TaxID=2937791 RepID=A0A9X1YDY2_9PROT|nr:carbon monoxide dehydrogenase subunit G [Roseomonas acroporae]MCK8786932.1 carbon monoxide dehydrogenase subunit G [Roseomonas acroporae]